MSGTGTISGFDANLNAATISSNNYTLVASDNGKVVTIDNSTTAAVSIPANLGDGFNCLVVQKVLSNYHSDCFRFRSNNC